MSSFQKELAAKILKVGVSRVWLDPTKMKDIEKGVTAIDIRKMIKKNMIKALPAKLHRPKEKQKRRKGRGSRKGAMYAIIPRKTRWISTVRPLRRYLKELKTSNQIENSTYRKMRMLVKGGMFRNKSHLRVYLDQHELLKKE